MEVAAEQLGSRDADVVEARLSLAALRFGNREFADAAQLFVGLIEDLTAERVPYDEQVMHCQRQLATCDAQNGDVGAALTRLRRLHNQMAVRYGQRDRRVADLAAQIRQTDRDS